MSMRLLADLELKLDLCAVPGAYLMEYPVVVKSESTNRYVAIPLGIPELKVTASTEAEVMAQVSRALEK